MTTLPTPRHLFWGGCCLFLLTFSIVELSAKRWGSLVTALLVTAVVFAAALFFSLRLGRRVLRLRRFAEKLLEAEPPESGWSDVDDELGALGRSLGAMSARTRELVDRLSLESARREAILASMIEGVLAVDNDLRVIFCNESFARAFGARLPVPERLPLLELVRDRGLFDLLNGVISTGGSQRRRLQVPVAKGRAFEVQATPIAATARPGAIAILHDITDRERLERIRKDFVANVSHELRTPITAIRGYAETLLAGALEDQQNNRKFLEIIEAHATRLNSIASDLLVLSELESDRPAAEPERVQVREALDSALHTVEREASVRGVKLLPEKIEEVVVIGHRIRLEQALVNLLDNAVKFNRPGGEVRIEAAKATDGKVWITVTDTGIGIPFEDLSRIFERFYRVDKARSRKVGGTGLGLSIVKHIVERMGGTVAVESQLGKGSKFIVLLPPQPPN